MAQSHEKIARDSVVAWLSHNDLHQNANNPPAKIGAQIAEIYTLVLQAVKDGSLKPA